MSATQVLTVGLNVLGGSPAGAFSIAAALMVMIYALGDVSGAHFNPAVTIAIAGCGRNKITPADIGAYIAAQLAGGVAAGFSYKALYGGKSFGLGPVGGHSWGEVAVAESVFTFVLCFVVLSVAISEKTSAPEFFGLAIGPREPGKRAARVRGGAYPVQPVLYVRALPAWFPPTFWRELRGSQGMGFVSNNWFH